MIRALVVACIFAFASVASAAPNGSVCTTPSDCDSTFCVDGVCCNAGCAGQCEACDVPDAVGTCSPVFGAPHGVRPACSGSMCAARVCDGVARDSCAAYADGNVQCAPPTCVGGWQTEPAYCDGKGSCAPPAPGKSCGAYPCGPDGFCQTKCASDADCAKPFRCVSDRCTEPAEPRTTCASDTVLVQLDGTAHDCFPHACAASWRTSFNAFCASCSGPLSAPCAAGYVCTAEGRCVAPQAEDTGCAFSMRGSHGVLALSILTALGAIRRRAR